ncbi:MAG TPA: YncE family protein [Thermoanaerobaculia bacterium]|jgi:DNA-binding beta-propeller fold protein YncE
MENWSRAEAIGLIVLLVAVIAAIANILLVDKAGFRRSLFVLLMLTLLGLIVVFYKFRPAGASGEQRTPEAQTSETQDSSRQEPKREAVKKAAGGIREGDRKKEEEVQASSTPLPNQKNTVVEATSPLLYATGAQNEGVYAISTSPFAKVGTAVTSLFNNAFVAVDPKRDRIYVAATNGGLVSVLSTSPLREIGTITGDVGWNTYSMVLSPDGGSLFLTCATQGGSEAHDNRVVVLDTEGRSTRTKLRVGDPHDVSYLAMSPSGRELFVSHNGVVDVYDSSTLALLRVCRPGGTMGRIAVSKDGAFLLVLQPGGLVRMRPDCSDVSTASLAGTRGYEPLSASARKGLFWVGGESERLYSFDARDLTVRSVDLGYKPEAFSESADAQHVYVVTGDKNVLLDLDVPTGKVVQSLAGIKDAYGLAAQ